MRFELFGSAGVMVNGQRLDIPRAQTRGILALVLLHAGRTLSPNAVIEAVWGGAAPPTALAQLHNGVRDIRRNLSRIDLTPIIRTDSYGYRADVDPDDVDALAFERGIQRGLFAARQGEDTAAVALLQEALARWTDHPLQNMSGAFVESAQAHLVDIRLTAIEELADLELRLGRPDEATRDLAPLVREYPMRERLRVRFMIALHRTGRSAEALRLAREYRALLAEQEGLDPGVELVEAESLIRRGEAYIPTSTSAPVPVSVPAQLPGDPAGFTGRATEIALLDKLHDERTPKSSRIVALVGVGGCGKTALAVHWAYQRLDEFDGGQLHLNLHGFGTDPTVDAFSALGQLLRGLGQPDATLPTSIDERSARYRSLLAGRRMLILLDNAASSEQVRPLLPGVGPHMTLITSRRRLDALSIGEGVAHLTVHPLPDIDAIQLLRRHAATKDVDHELLSEAARLCGGLPLALRIIAARLSDASPPSAAGLLADLADHQRRLTTLSLPAEDVGVRGAIAASYRALSATGQRVFQFLGLMPSAQTAVEPCAAALEMTGEQAASGMEELHGSHLAARSATGRYHVHDLVRLYAAELVDEDSEAARVSAERRLLRWYTSVADNADAAIRPHRGDLLIGPSSASEHFSDSAGALSWFESEADNLLAAVATASQRHPELCWRLAAVSFGWLERRQRTDSWLAVYEAGVRAAEAVGDLPAQAIMAQSLAIANCYAKRFDEAATAFQHALAIRRELGQDRQAGTTLMNLGSVYVETKRDVQALRSFDEALRIFEALPGADLLVGAAYNNLGWAHYVAGRHDEAIDCYEEALRLAHACGDAQSVAHAETNIALSLADCDAHAQAIVHWQRGLDHARRAGDLRLEASALAGLGKGHFQLGNHAAAREPLTAALGVYEEIGDEPAAEMIEMLSLAGVRPILR